MSRRLDFRKLHAGRLPGPDHPQRRRRPRPPVCSYDALGNVLSSTDARGFTTTFDRNEMGEVYRVTGPAPYNSTRKHTMERAFVGIPILNRLDLLARCLAAIDHPAEVVVVNNNATDVTFESELQRLAAQRSMAADAVRVRVLNQERNLGVAASWNLILRTGFADGHESVFIGSNDTFLRPGSLSAALAGKADAGLCYLHAWNFFLVRKAAVDSVGWFDENFYPAYKEDQDYAYRCKLAGARRVNVAGASAEHVGSATIHSDPRYRLLNRTTHDWNRRYYIEKWGGDATQERFDRPFNLAEKDWRWWPDPGASIAERDWNAPQRDEE